MLVMAGYHIDSAQDDDDPAEQEPGSPLPGNEQGPLGGQPGGGEGRHQDEEHEEERPNLGAGGDLAAEPCELPNPGMPQNIEHTGLAAPSGGEMDVDAHTGAPTQHEQTFGTFCMVLPPNPLLIEQKANDHAHHGAVAPTHTPNRRGASHARGRGASSRPNPISRGGSRGGTPKRVSDQHQQAGGSGGRQTRSSAASAAAPYAAPHQPENGTQYDPRGSETASATIGGWPCEFLLALNVF